MKTKFKKRYNLKALAFLVMLAVAATSCKKDFFDLKNRNAIGSDIWNSEGSIQFFLNDTYDNIMPRFPYSVPANNFMYATDEDFRATADGIERKLIGTNGVLAVNDIKFIGEKYQNGANRYFDIARCNNAIKFLPTSTLPKASVDKFKGQFYALRAMAYFELVRLYGGVPLVLEPQDPTQNIYIERSKAEECFKVIVRDLDSAIVMLPKVWDDASERGKITKQAAMALKGKALMYWASPQFNPNDGVHQYDESRWNVAYDAVKLAYDTCVANGSLLMPKYEEIFTKEGSSNTEALIVRSYSASVAKGGHDIEYYSRPASEGGSGGQYNAPTWNLVKAYTMDDGTPITQSSSYDQGIFWVNRDPRFYATVAYNGSAWPLSGNAARKQWAYTGAALESPLTGTGFYGKKFCDNSLLPAAVPYRNDFGGNGMDWIEMRFAEVILDLAECANEIGHLEEAKDYVRKIRIRAGIKLGANDYGLGLAGDKDQMHDLIMNEREVEFAFEGKRFFDLRRTRQYHLLAGTMDKIVWTAKNKTFLETNNSSGIKNRETLDLNNKTVFDANFTMEVKPIVNTQFNVLEAYYFLPLPNTFFNSSPSLEQTIGYEGGTFDPIKLK